MNGTVHRGHVGRYHLLRAYGARKREQLGGRKEPGGRPESMNSFTKPKFDRKVCEQIISFNELFIYFLVAHGFWSCSGLLSCSCLEPVIWKERQKVNTEKYIAMLEEQIFHQLRAMNPLHPNSLEGYIWMQVEYDARHSLARSTSLKHISSRLFP